MLKKMKIIVVLTMLVSVLFSSVTAYAAEKEFDYKLIPDVRSSDWYYGSVYYVNKHGLMTGYADGSFGPLDVVTRGQFATILYRLEGSPETVYEDQFEDVKDGFFYSHAAIWASENGIITGYTNGCFGPDDPITREQIATILYRYADKKGEDITEIADISSYPDAYAVSDFARTAMGYAVEKGIIKGSNGELKPQGNAVRAELATILTRYVGGETDVSKEHKVSYALLSLANYIDTYGYQIDGVNAIFETDEDDGVTGMVILYHDPEKDTISYVMEVRNTEGVHVVLFWDYDISSGTLSSEFDSGVCVSINKDNEELLTSIHAPFDIAAYKAEDILEFTKISGREGVTTEQMQDLNNYAVMLGIYGFEYLLMEKNLGTASDYGFSSYVFELL